MNPANIQAQAQKIVEYEAKRAKMLAEYNHCITYRTDKRPITKINYRIDRVSKEATMRIERDNQPLSLVVLQKFGLKQLGFSEWIEVHTLASKGKVFQRENEFHLATTVQLIRQQSAIQRGTLEAEEMLKKLEYTIEARNDVNQARKIVKENLDDGGM
ncbi:hypothetical protein Tco_1454168 [Tanacetum coccineum]